VFELMAFFAGYGFNRSHSAAYGWVTYQTAYLKHHYPHEFMAGLMSCDADNIDNIVKFIAEARAMGLTVERPDVDESAADFTVTPRPGALGDKVIRFGMGAVKGVGVDRGRGDARRAQGRRRLHVDLRASAGGSTPSAATAG
jgi:DNA polymerase-3 subunit alpha